VCVCATGFIHISLIRIFALLCGSISLHDTEFRVAINSLLEVRYFFFSPSPSKTVSKYQFNQGVGEFKKHTNSHLSAPLKNGALSFYESKTMNTVLFTLIRY
jgi:hypothetical protein